MATSELFTENPPTEPGFYWVMYTQASQPEVAFGGGPDGWAFAGSHWTGDPAKYGPRVPSAADCAANPDLLSACEAVATFFQEFDVRPEDEGHELYAVVSDAIAKAKGVAE